MVSLAEKLNEYESGYWDFSEYREKNPLMRYPATMVAPMQEQLIKDILNDDSSIINILDPFVGSGTVLSIGNKYSLDVFGIDINPLAILITRAKLEGIPGEKIYKSIAELKMHITLLLGNACPFNFDNIKKWFRDDVISDLSVIRHAIQMEQDINIRRFYWVCFADIVKKYSNTRSSTFKLHTKEANKIISMENDSIQCFIAKVTSICSRYISQERKNNVNLTVGDSGETLKLLQDKSIDLICTSPPYGDNHTTVTYGQYSVLPLLWIDHKDMDPFEKGILSNFTKIDTLSLGGSLASIDEQDLYNNALPEGINKVKLKKIRAFYQDYSKVFAQMARILKPGKRMVLTIGNRRVDNHEVPFNKLNDFLAKTYGLTQEAIIIRNIHGKRMPPKVSHLPDYGSVKSMSKEFVVIYKK